MCAPEPDFHLPHFSFITIRLVFKLRFLHEYSGVSMIGSAYWSSPEKCLLVMLALQVVGGIFAHQYFHAVFPDLFYHKLLTLIVWNF